MPGRVRLRSRAVPIEWHEAVAVVQEVASQLVLGGAVRVPAADQLTIEPGGAISILATDTRAVTSDREGGRKRAKGDSRRSSTTNVFSEPDWWAALARKDQDDFVQAVRGLGLLLKELLDGIPAPEGLTSLADRAVNDPGGFDSPEGFSRDLAFFERPGRTAILRALAERRLAVQDQAEVETELETLTRKARHVEPSAGPRPGERTSRAQPRSRALIVAGVLVAVGFLVAAAVGVPWKPNANQVEAARASGQALAERGERLAGAWLSGVRSFLGIEAAPLVTETPVPREAPTRVVSRGGAKAVPPASEAQGPWLGTQPIFTLPSIPVSIDVARIARDAEADRGVHDPAALGRIYGPRDTGVDPPTLLRPQLPTHPAPGIRADMLSTVELLVAEDGRVEQVRLTTSSIARRYYDAMLLAAAKSWRFQPARMDGTPVRYRVLVQLTQ